MSHPTDETSNPIHSDDWTAPSEVTVDHLPTVSSDFIEVEEAAPDGGSTHGSVVDESSVVQVVDSPKPKSKPKKTSAIDSHHGDAPQAVPVPDSTPSGAAPYDDDDEKVELVWYVLKVQSSREDTIRDALERRVKIQGLTRYFGKIVVPTEKITEMRNNKKKVVERKTYPGYIMVEMELNEKTWFVVRETPGVGDFVGAHGTPSKMTMTEVNQMLGQETSKTEEAPAKVRIDVERGDRVKIKDGPFENFEGTVEEVIEARGLVKVTVIIFNRPTPVDLEYWKVELI